MKKYWLVIFVMFSCVTKVRAYGSDIDAGTSSVTDPELLKLLQPERFVRSTSWQNWHLISVRPVYVPDLPGHQSVVGKYECPLTYSDSDQLRKGTTSYLMSRDLQILFDKDDGSLAVVIALKKTDEPSQFVAYRVRMEIKVYPESAVAGGVPGCDILFSAHRISGKIKEGKRSLNGAALADDDVTQGLMVMFQSFATHASERPPRERSLLNFWGY